MRIPDALFPLINFVVRNLLRSPLHGLVSDSLMIIHFRGRKSGKAFATPVRYNRANDAIQCFTAKSNNWWKNLGDGNETELWLAGRSERYIASVITDDPEVIRAGIAALLAKFPADAPYYEIHLNPDKTPVEKDLDQASHQTVLVQLKAAA